jgi:hypothetical protein
LRRQPVWQSLAAFALLGVLAGVPACTLPPDAPTVIASATGTGPDDAYRVVSATQQADVLRLLGLEQRSRVLRVIDGRPFDVLTVYDPATANEREVWFDIARYFRR